MANRRTNRSKRDSSQTDDVQAVDLDAVQGRPDPQREFDGWCQNQDRQWDRIVGEAG